MTLDFSCSFKTKVSFSRYQIRLLTPLPRASMHSCSLSIQVFYNLSTLCFLYDWARSNQQGSLTQGAHRARTWCICTPGVKGSLVYWTCSFKGWSMWSWDLNNWAGEFQQRKQVFCGKSNSEAAQPLLVSVSHGTDFTQNCTSHNVSTTALLDFPLSSLELQKQRLHLVSRVFSRVWELNLWEKLFLTCFFLIFLSDTKFSTWKVP